MIFISFTQTEVELVMKHCEFMIIRCNKQLDEHVKLTKGNTDPEYIQAVQSVCSKADTIYQKLYRLKNNVLLPERVGE